MQLFFNICGSLVVVYLCSLVQRKERHTYERLMTLCRQFIWQFKHTHISPDLAQSATHEICQVVQGLTLANIISAANTRALSRPRGSSSRIETSKARRSNSGGSKWNRQPQFHRPTNLSPINSYVPTAPRYSHNMSTTLDREEDSSPSSAHLVPWWIVGRDGRALLCFP